MRLLSPESVWVIGFITLPLSLLDIRWLLAVGIRRSVLHLLIGLLLGLCSLLSLLLGLSLLLFRLSLGLLLCALLGQLLLLDLSSSLLFFLALVVEALDDWAGRCSQLVELGNVLCLGGVLAVFVQPVLQKC